MSKTPLIIETMAQVPPQAAAVLATVLRYRRSGRRLQALLPHQTWVEAFQLWAGPAVQAWCTEQRLELLVAPLDEAPRADEETAEVDGTLDSLLRDPGNAFALASCRRIVEAPGLEHNPLFLHGPRGSGKTALARAVAREYRNLLGERGVVVLEGVAFVGQTAHQLADRRDAQLREQLEQAALIVLDSVEALAGRALAQEEAFRLINEALERGQQVLACGRLPPNRIGLEERLATRLAWGLAVGLELPQLETRLALLRQLGGEAVAALDQARLPDLVESQAVDYHAVIALADRVRSGALPASGEAASFDRILAVVAQDCGLRTGDLIGKRRSRTVAQARQTALYLARRLTGHKLESLGALVGGRDHSTVIYSLRQAEQRAESDAAYAEKIRGLTQKILAG